MTRVGIGYDIHPFADGRRLILCGVEFPGEAGLAGHSDADVALHALSDALLGAAALGAAAGQTVVADSTTVLLYKLMRAAAAGRSDRTEVVADTENFPTDRFVLEGVAAEHGLTVRWITPDASHGVTEAQVRALIEEAVEGFREAMADIARAQTPEVPF